jgi:hypothetical protein
VPTIGPLELHAAQLTPIVRRLLRRDDVLVSLSHVERLDWLNIMDAALWRAAGTAMSVETGTHFDWSIVLKAFIPVADSPSSNPARWDYWRREIAAYEGGVLDDLPGGVTAPRFLGLLDAADGRIVIAMEEIADAGVDHWTYDRYRRAAAAIGRFNASYLGGRARPAHPAFAPGGLRSWCDDLATAVAETDDLWERPLVKRAIPDPSEAMLLFAQRGLLLDALDRLPQTFVHRDLWPSNVLVRTVDGTEQFVAIDWMLAGTGALGEDVAGIIGPTLWHFLVEPPAAAEFEAVVTAGYLAGLRSARRMDDVPLVEFGYRAALALRFGMLIPPWLGLWLESESQRAWAELKFKRSIDAIVGGWGEQMPFLLERADRAQHAGRALGLIHAPSAS